MLDKQKGRFGDFTSAPFALMRPPEGGRYRFNCCVNFLVHAAHAACAWGAAAVGCAGFLGFLDVGHQSFGGEH